MSKNMLEKLKKLNEAVQKLSPDEVAKLYNKCINKNPNRTISEFSKAMETYLLNPLNLIDFNSLNDKRMELVNKNMNSKINTIEIDLLEEIELFFSKTIDLTEEEDIDLERASKLAEESKVLMKKILER